jgi:tetratricopeptide (TPR) repeat protein
VRGPGKSFKAVVRHKRQDLDLCQLEVAGMRIPAVALGTAKNLRVGVLVYAVAASSGQNAHPAVSTAEISGTLPYEGSWYMRVSAVPSTGFQGAGLFNAAGQLVGIISRGSEGQKLAFALPADWITDMEKQNSPASGVKKEGGLDWLNRSFALEKKGDWRGLLKLSQQQVSRDPHSAAGWFEVASASAHLKQYKQAVHAYREAIRNQAGYGDAWHGLGTAYMHLKEYDHAARALRDAVRLQPDNAEAWYALGNAYYKSEQYPHAIHAYDQSLRFDPGNAAVWYSLGKAYDELDLYGDAIDAYRETVRIEPKNVDALYSLGVDYAIAGERAEMRRIYSALLPLDRTKAEKYFNTYILP